MGQTTLLTEQIDAGTRLIDELEVRNFDVGLAFWAFPTDDEKWFLYLVSNEVGDLGPAAAYRTLHGILRQIPDLWIQPLEVRLLDPRDSLATDVLSAAQRKHPVSPFAIPIPKPYPGPTWLGPATVAGIDMDEIRVYPVRTSVSP